MHRRDDKAVAKGAQRSELIDSLCFLTGTACFPQHPLGEFDGHVAHRERAPVPAHGFLLAQSVANHLFVPGPEEVGQELHRHAGLIDVME
jgi:hypothetical protein